ncbi:MAG: redox-sensing transcriptional repressor Rex [Ruminococcaceae bacterium]|nr:redox-sensing transcriptional repressor Rex [Oscillospiraceae bacterium]
MAAHSISKSTLSRLPLYLEFLKTHAEDGPAYISAAAIAQALGLGEVQVRKDLASVSTAGRPKVGYQVTQLVGELENFLGYDNKSRVVVVGTGRLGRALLEYEGFQSYGLEIVAGFDLNPPENPPKPIYSMHELAAYCREHQVEIGVLAVPTAVAQQVCDQMVKCGIRAILNFAPVHLSAPAGILVHNENIAVSLAMLSEHLNQE